MDVRELITFKTVSETRNFSKAADILGYTQSTVSMQIKSLELELGAKLFEYKKRQVSITDAGLQVVAYGRKNVRKLFRY